MGIQGLWPLIEPASSPITLDSLEGKRLAIDVSFWLHQALHGYSSSRGQTSKCPHLTLLINRIAKLLFYKIRPIFVFDGDEVPVFKHKTLRDRSLKRHMDELLVSKSQKRLLLDQVAVAERSRSSDSFGESSRDTSLDAETNGEEPLSKRHNEDVDSSHDCGESDVPSTSASVLQQFDQTNEREEINEVLAEVELLDQSSINKRIDLLTEARERARQARLNPEDIPSDSKKFSDFQLKRLLNRNKINAQIDLLKSDRLQQKVVVSRDQMKVVVCDSQLRKHFLLKENDVQVLSPSKQQKEKMLRESLTWPQFLKQVEQEKSSENGGKPDEDDDDLQEAILASLTEQNRLSKNCSRNLNVSGFLRNSKEDGGPKNGRSFQQRPNSTDFIDDDEESSSSEEDEFVDVSSGEENEEIQILGEKSLDVISSSFDVAIEGEDFLPDENFSQNGEESEYFGKRKKNVESLGGQTREKEEQGAYVDCQRLLSILGLPFIQAPGEAEAQCAELERLNLVDGVVSDDSDVWLFGARLVYRNMFSQKKFVQEYRAEEIRRKIGLTRREFIQLGMLAGGDYTRGLEQVGTVTALEMIAEFVGKSADKEGAEELEKSFNCLERIRDWLLSKQEFMAKSNGNDDEERKDFIESATRIRLRRIVEGNNSEETIKQFPSSEVFNAYAKPRVNDSTRPFRWERVKFDRLYQFLNEKLGMDEQALKRVTHGAFLRWDEFMEQSSREYQTRITAFARPIRASTTMRLGDQSDLAPTARVQAALDRLRASNAQPVPQEKIIRKRPSTITSKKKMPKRKLAKKIATKIRTTQDERGELELSEESSNSGDEQ